ncbi:uncharacterized protein LOC133912472 isoform X2 [Phragmites australis]|uniref:uncharacterized protein LOC133912472 isoform X2 n=1 Tax=Phragmites australis TaxID=29695 RepID=UPI002D78A5DB|nr:uncharacterized protein LOC133912472 isoform X2 [Phragmites australis]
MIERTEVREREMMSRECKKAAALQEKLKILRSITHSHALSNTSIIMDASEYIKELKQKVVRLKQEIACAQDALRQNSYPTVTVETLGGHGFLINVFSDKSYPGLLVAVLETFDELGLSVLQATASCADSFRLEAAGGESVDEHVVKQAVLQAIRSCSESGSEHSEE